MVTLINIQTLQEFRILPYCINAPPPPFRNITGSIVSRSSLTSLIMAEPVETETRRNLKK